MPRQGSKGKIRGRTDRRVTRIVKEIVGARVEGLCDTKLITIPGRRRSEGAAEGASGGAGEAIGEAATNKFLEKHPLSRNAIIAIVVDSVVTLLLCLPIYLRCREKTMGRYQQIKLEREGGYEKEARGLVQ
jgi:hypothetical protein